MLLRMVFYICPPSGRVHFERLQGYGEKRLLFLLAVRETEGCLSAIHQLMQCESVFRNTDCLVEGSMQDIASHFILRFTSCRYQNMLDALVVAESMLFKYRIETLSWEEKRELFEHAMHEVEATRQCHLSDEYRGALSTLERVLRTVLARWDSIRGGQHFTLSIPFQHVLRLVDQRLVTLKNGSAITSTSSINGVLESLFDTVLNHAIVHFSQSPVFRAMEEDMRMTRIQTFLRATYRHRTRQPRPSLDSRGVALTAGGIDAVAKFFPPCMAHHHRRLRTVHRLPHTMRIEYTLFLKEIGLPLDEALKFWSQEYMRTCSKSSSCSHTWNKDRRRFSYSIRHLYGYEGSRKNYSSHSCRHLQQNASCPLVACSKEELLEHVSYHKQVQDVEDIWKLCSEGRHLTACQLHQQQVHVHHNVQSSALQKNCCKPKHQTLNKDSKTCGRDVAAITSLNFRKPTEYYASLMNLFCNCNT
ncbi:uncharacterized protein LOC135389109 [Ornithodoros turicata]|uniref:uncharacterized protein LOC135389109 n=1 Tax=Ornithodoros turicata TaxID=34597 RepID=UPI00313984F6